MAASLTPRNFLLGVVRFMTEEKLITSSRMADGMALSTVTLPTGERFNVYATRIADQNGVATTSPRPEIVNRHG